MHVRLTDHARADLGEIGDYIALNSRARAKSFVQELRASCKALGAFPFGAPPLDGFEAQGFRRAVHGPYLIIYRVRAGEVEILRVVHGSRDLSAALSR